MEMPEGWKNLYETTQTAVVEAHNASDDEQARFATQILRHIYLEPLTLMKEMAEALEFIREREQADGRVGTYLPAWFVLQKFKEWK